MLIYQGCVSTMATFRLTPTANLIAKGFFFLFIFIFFSFFRYEHIDTYAHTFLTLIILAIVTV